MKKKNHVSLHSIPYIFVSAVERSFLSLNVKLSIVYEEGCDVALDWILHIV